MPKVATKFIADVTVKVGRQSLVIKVPVDLVDVQEKPEEHVLSRAQDRVRTDLKVSVANLPELKRAFKAFRAAHA